MQPDILILDDTTAITDVFSIALKINQYAVRTVNNIEALFKELQQKMPHLLIIDTTLNGRDGRDLCKQLKTEKGLHSTPVILMSASPQKLTDYKDYCADDILEKPFDINNMLEKVKNFVPYSAAAV